MLWDASIANSDLGIHVSPDQELDIESLYNQVVTAYSEQTAREAESQKTGSDSNEIQILIIVYLLSYVRYFKI